MKPYKWVQILYIRLEYLTSYPVIQLHSLWDIALTAFLQMGKTYPPHNAECPKYNVKPYDGESPVLESWGMGSTPSFPLLPSPLRPGGIVPVKVTSIGQIEPLSYLLYLKLCKCVQTND